jgi:hypothetical protein
VSDISGSNGELLGALEDREVGVTLPFKLFRLDDGELLLEPIGVEGEAGIWFVDLGDLTGLFSDEIDVAVAEVGEGLEDIEFWERDGFGEELMGFGAEELDEGFGVEELDEDFGVGFGDPGFEDDGDDKDEAEAFLVRLLS